MSGFEGDCGKTAEQEVSVITPSCVHTEAATASQQLNLRMTGSSSTGKAHDKEEGKGAEP